jgi:hypothetical protein
MEGTREKPSLMFLLPKMDRGHLDQYIRKELEKQGITEESQVQAIVDKAEAEYEKRIKVEEAKRELKRLMAIRANGGKLTSVGHKKWAEASYRPIGGK